MSASICWQAETVVQPNIWHAPRLGQARRAPKSMLLSFLYSMYTIFISSRLCVSIGYKHAMPHFLRVCVCAGMYTNYGAQAIATVGNSRPPMTSSPPELRKKLIRLQKSQLGCKRASVLCEWQNYVSASYVTQFLYISQIHLHT